MMKRTTLFTLLLLVASGAMAQQSRLFVRGGVGEAEYWLMNAQGSKGIFGYQLGVGAELPFKNSSWGFQPIIQYVAKGAQDEETSLTMHLNYLEVPLDFYYKAEWGKGWGFKVAVGPYLSYGLNGQTKVSSGAASVSVDSFSDEHFRRVDAGLNTDFYFSYNKFFFGMSYDMGFIPVHEKSRGDTWPSNYTGMFSIGVYL